MSAEKSNPPAYHSDEVPAAGPSNKKTVLLASYCAAITALLVATVIFGTLFYVQKSPSSLQIPTERKVKTQIAKVEDPFGVKALVKTETDYENLVHVVTITNNGTANGSIVVFDYMKSQTSLYIPSEAKCFLIGGIDKSVKTPFEGDHMIGDEEEAPILRYKVPSDYPAMDRSLLPQELRVPCSGLPVYWLKKDCSPGDDLRVKREAYSGLVLHCKCCIHIITEAGQEHASTPS